MKYFEDIFERARTAVNSSADVEIFADRSNGTTVVWSEKKLEDCYTSEAQGIGLRIIRDGKAGFSYTNDFSKTAVDNLISSAIKNCEFLPPDKHNSLSFPSTVKSELDINDKSFGMLSIEDKISLLRDEEKRALSNKKVKSVLKTSYSESMHETFIINSNGVMLASSGTVFSYSMSCVACEGHETQVGGESTVRRISDELNFSETTAEAVKNSVELLGAKRIKTGNYPIIFNQNVGCEFLSLFGLSFSAFSVQKNVSLLKGKLGQKVCSDMLNIIDDGTLLGGVATSSFDDDGIPTQRTIILEKGVLKNYFYDLYTANKDNVKPTGNASRSYSGLSVPAPTNIYIEQGKTSFNNLLKNIDKGLYITETMGMHNADAVSGEFSVGINGFFIENGSIKFPVHGVTIAGNIMDLFNNISDLGNDLKFYGNIGSPSFLVNRLTVAGE
ncbi:MAG: TldD/PmbA family protein [Elusimicrobia bacterium]|nr:TldD/PmbA family protein [Elusimicrobiota bacterium]